MNTIVNKSMALTFVAALFAAMISVTVSAAAQPNDAGWKMRGMRDSSSGGARYYAAPTFRSNTGSATEAADGYRSFSYEPAAFQAGDTVVVVADGAKLMDAAKVVGTVAKGQKFQVRKVVGPWLGTETEVSGKTVKGWVLLDNVTLENASGATAPRAEEKSPSVATQPPAERRSFSYEPAAPQSRSYTSGSSRSSSNSSKPEWSKQKMLRNF